jgi:beta-1,2-mannobiose phosphorylase / 1,2-beta-oligomannan phosphorylase
VKDLNEFDGKKFIRSRHGHAPSQESSWDNWVRGAGPPPIKTKHGWLLLYHAMDNRDPDRYKLGAMLLDLKHPEKVLYRSKRPILEPEEIYENEGWKSGVVYACGAVVLGQELFVYYGGADKFSCVASIPLVDLIEDLKKEKPAQLKRAKAVKI